MFGHVDADVLQLQFEKTQLHHQPSGPYKDQRGAEQRG